LAVNLTGAVSTGAVTIDSDIKTLNISGNTTASTIASLVASGATTVNVSGDAKVIFTGTTIAAATAINVTNTAGAEFKADAIGTTTVFTGGDGADYVVIPASYTKATNLGAGNDSVVYSGAASTTTGAVGTISAGDGTDTIFFSNALLLSDTPDANSAFNTAFTGFETLRVSTAYTVDALDLDGINSVSKVILASGVSGTAAFSNLPSAGTVEIRADGASTPALTVGVRAALNGANDSINLVLSKSGGVLDVGSVTVANVETVNITANDYPTTPAVASNANINVMTLAATSAKTVTVSGNNGLTLTNTNNSKITSFDASGVVANDTVASTYVAATEDTAINLAVTFASANTTATADVTIKGGAGNDTLSGTIAKDTISGGAGKDAIYADNAGTKQVGIVTLAGGDATAGKTFTVSIDGLSVTHTAASGKLTVTDLAAALKVLINDDATLGKLVTASNSSGVLTLTSKVDGVNPITVSENDSTTTMVQTTLDGNNSTTVGTAGTVAVDVIDGGAGADVIVGGGGADTITTGTGADSVFFLDNQSDLATMATITDFTYAVGGSSNDKIIIGDLVAVSSNKLTVQDFSSSATLAAAFGAAALANTTDLGLSVFVWGGDSYVFVEATGATATYVTGDFAVKLTGLPLAVGATIAGAGFDAV